MELYFKKYGESGPPLLILHGLLGASGNWHTLSQKRFSEHFQVYAVDQRNHGRSPHSERFGYAAMAEDVRDLIEREDLPPAHLLGHSMGGKTAMHAALRFPERVDRLVVADMAPRAYPPHHREILNALADLDLARHDERDSIDEALAERIPSKPVRQFLLKNLDYDSEGGYSWKMNLDAISASYENVNAAVESDTPFEGPALFVRGEQSGYVMGDDEDDIRALFPQAEIVTVEGAGHWLHADEPQAFAGTVMDFLTAGEAAAHGWNFSAALR